MVRLSAIFVTICMVLIAVSIGVVLFLGIRAERAGSDHRRNRRVDGARALRRGRQATAQSRLGRRSDRQSFARHGRPCLAGRRSHPAGRRIQPADAAWSSERSIHAADQMRSVDPDIHRRDRRTRHDRASSSPKRSPRTKPSSPSNTRDRARAGCRGHERHRGDDHGRDRARTPCESSRSSRANQGL